MRCKTDRSAAPPKRGKCGCVRCCAGGGGGMVSGGDVIVEYSRVRYKLSTGLEYSKYWRMKWEREIKPLEITLLYVGMALSSYVYIEYIIEYGRGWVLSPEMGEENRGFCKITLLRLHVCGGMREAAWEWRP